MSDIVDRLRKRVVTRWVHAVGTTPRSSGYSPDRECHEAADEIARLRAEVEALRKDAERYRFIRDADRSDCITPEMGLYCMETLDEYVDAAMEDEARNATIDAAKGGEHCRYPDCNCPFDAPADPTWCAKGLPRQAKGGGNG